MTEHENSTPYQEVKGFLFLTVVLAPAISVALVGSYGFAIWISQLLLGPPTTP